MSAVVCEHCEAWINDANHRHPGYCSPLCRDTDRDTRQQARREKRQRRLELAEQHRVLRAIRGSAR